MRYMWLIIFTIVVAGFSFLGAKQTHNGAPLFVVPIFGIITGAVVKKQQERETGAASNAMWGYYGAR
jgi:hypothetical protein